MTIESKPPFASYLLPALFRWRRKSSTTSITTVSTTSSLYSRNFSSPSTNTTPSSSPPRISISPSSTTSWHTFTEGCEIAPHSSSSSSSSCHSQEVRLSRTNPNILRCKNCSTDLAFTSQIVSKCFTGRHGRAYLVAPPPPPPFKRTFPPKPRPKAELINTKTGRPMNRELLTGMHIVADVACVVCGTVVGWKYVDAREAGQRYKIGKVILERERVCVSVSWEDGDILDGEEERLREEDERWESRDVCEREVGIEFDSGDEEECEDLFAGVWDKDITAKRRRGRIERRREAADISDE